MRFAFAATLFALASSVVAAPLDSQAMRYAGLARIPNDDSSLLEKRYCSQMPSKPDMNMVKIVYQTVLKRSKDPKVMLITFITAYRESMFNNLNCGDKNSLGLFQQQWNMGWGTKEQIRDPVYSTNKFLDVLLGIYPANKGKGAGILAQMVQNAEAGEKYTENIPKGNELIAAAKKMVGDNSDDDKPAPAPVTTTKSSGGGNGGAINVGGKPTPQAPSKPTNTKTQDGPKQTPPADQDKTDSSDDDEEEEDCECTKYYVPVRGDICYTVAGRFNLKLDEFYKLNPQIDAHCQNLYAGQKYCVSTDPADAAAN